MLYGVYGNVPCTGLIPQPENNNVQIYGRDSSNTKYNLKLLGKINPETTKIKYVGEYI